jgi:RES domain-containing protein
MTVYRMHRSARAAKDYTGAMLAGGRWNPIGTPMLYAARHLSLACIEVLVHLDKGQLPRDHVWSKAELSSPLGLLSFNDLNDYDALRWSDARPFRFDPPLFVAEPYTL